MARAIYLTHPEVLIQPDVAVPDWGLSAVGHARVTALCERLKKKCWRIAASTERKALETAWPLAAICGAAPVEIRHELGENDRSSTGFLREQAFQEAADAFFGAPEVSFQGWERAVDAQARVLQAVQSLLAEYPSDNLLICGHGGVGTLLYCALAGKQIDRIWDQSGGGHWFAFDTVSMTPESHWQPMEDLRL